ncbi:hypothetical protein K435DRAFT_744206 [Dendrothele bispora CBS 962.96]|uniref:UBC core domain-containing protein n=1 Tax=Dendrothele bispora (strain CBS 962.96) TaxID=1314807 RepID=A0A4S8MS99_DENBC|nr:hypothetical protein K435DRAFT_744206 [Dendrothele bispora CBS 962.96]
MPRQPVAATKFYQQDIVQKASSNSYGIVLRCWHDAEDMPIPPAATLADPLMRPLRHGEVGVSWLTEGGRREILPESELHLLDRTLQPGDFCKRSVDDVQSGVVTDLRVRCRVEHVINKEPVEGWKTSSDIYCRSDAEIGDYVICDDWIGQVVELFDENIIEVPSGQLVRLPEFSSRLAVGEKSENILPPPGGVQHMIGFLFGHPSRSSGLETVIAVKHTVYAIAWLAINQRLDILEAQKRPRPARFWYGQEISKLTLLRGRADFQMRTGDRLNLKNNTGLPFTKHGQEGEAGGVVCVQSFSVTATETELSVLWQDGTKETLNARDVIPYLNPDEYDCWPGDHVIWSSEGVKRPAVVQAVDSAQRTAKVLFVDTKQIEMVSLLELDPHGASDLEPAQGGIDGLGVRRGDFVFIHNEGLTNGYEPPRVPKIGELESWVRENPFIGGMNQLSGWRKEMADLGTDIATRRGKDGVVEGQMKRPSENGPVDWIGEVFDLNLDGTVQILHPDNTVQTYPLERLTKLYDGIEQLEDEIYEGGNHMSSPYEEEETWAMNEDGEWVQQDHSDEWEEYEEYDDAVEFMDSMDSGDSVYRISGAGIPEDDPEYMSLDPILPPPSGSQTLKASSTEDIPTPNGDSSHTPREESEDDNMTDNSPNEEKKTSWKHFDILPQVPPDHAYYSTIPMQHSRSFLARLQREYHILSGSLPDSIIVRAFEDRADLLRCLIIGPQNTPYEDAPFVIDWMLDSNFPNSPPLAHFLSWTNGNGRVNPNLYEEGKVCLSILGTWAGDKNETWSASRSSLLQAFISIQGLVLVKEPWYCEPAYDKLRGTKEGAVNSRLYSEKAYVLSRNFVFRALDIPLGGLESEMKWLYYTNRRLEKVVSDARALIEKSKEASSSTTAEEDEVAIPRLTAGGIITLERTLTKLQGLLDAQSTTPKDV